GDDVVLAAVPGPAEGGGVRRSELAGRVVDARYAGITAELDEQLHDVEVTADGRGVQWPSPPVVDGEANRSPQAYRVGPVEDGGLVQRCGPRGAAGPLDEGGIGGEQPL